jgi:hypothetical protein
MPRLTNLLANVATGVVRDAVSGAQLNTSTYPFTSAKELSEVQIQYITEFFDINAEIPYTKYLGFAGQTVDSSAVIDNDFNHVDKGSLAVALPAGATTSIEITEASLDNIPQTTGAIQLVNSGSQTETVAYTSVSLVGLNYVFVVDVTLAYSYDIGNQANTNDPPLVKSTTVDVTNKDTGLFVVTIDTNTQPYLFEAEGRSSITGCIFEQQIRDNTGQKIFEFQFPFVCNNSLDDDGALPPPVGFDFYTKLEVDALLNNKIDKVPTATAGHVATFTADGGVEDGGEAGLGDMTKTQYDPQLLEKDAFLSSNHNESILSLVDADFIAGVRPISVGEIGSILTVNITAPTGGFAIEMPNLVGTERNIKTTVNYMAGTPELDVTTIGGTQLIGGLITQSLLEGQRIEVVNNDTAYDLVNDDRAETGGITEDIGINTGVIYGLDVTENANNISLDISAGDIFIRDYITDPQNPVYKKCTLDAPLNLALPNIATTTFTQPYAVEDLPTNPNKVRIEFFEDTEGSTSFYKNAVKLQIALHPAGTISEIGTRKQLAYNHTNSIAQVLNAIGSIADGIKIIDNEVDDLSVKLEAGTLAELFINSSEDQVNDSIKAFLEQDPLVMNYNSTDFAGNFPYEADSTVLKPSSWNNPVTKIVEAVPDGKFTIQRCIFFASDSVGVAYGQQLFNSQAEAISCLQCDYVKNPAFSEGAPITYIICKSGATSTKDIGDILFAQVTRLGFDTGLSSVSIRPGFFDVNKAELTYDNPTRTLDLLPIAPETSVKVRLFNGSIVERDSFSWTNSNVEGLHYFYLDDNGDEQISVGPNRETQNNLLRSTVSTAFMQYGNASFDKAVITTDYRKEESGMSPDTTTKNFFDIQIYPLDGVPPTDFPVNPLGNAPTDMQFGFATDELLFAGRQFNFPAFSRGDTWRVIYLDGSNVRYIDKVGYAFLTGADFGLGTDYPVFNDNGTPDFANPPNANSPRYVWYFMAVTNDIEPSRRMVSIMGNAEYISSTDANDALANELVKVENQTSIKQELRVVYAVLYEVDLDYTNLYSSVALEIQAITIDSSTGASASIPSGLVDGSIADDLHKHTASSLVTSTLGVNDADDSIYLANGAGGVKVEDFDTRVSANSDVTANTAKVTNATHTGEVTGSTTLTVDKTVISNKATVTAVAGDFVLVGDASDNDNLKKVNVSDFLGGGTGYTPPITEDAVVDTDALVADTVTSTLALDGTVTIPDVPASHGIKYFITTKGSGAIGRIEFVTSGDAIIPTFTDVDEILCIEGSTINNSYKVVR